MFYKVRYHGSNLATLSKKGLEQMANLKIACIPIDHDMAAKKRWGSMPLVVHEARLNEMKQGGILLMDQTIPSVLSGRVHGNELY